MKNKVLIGLLTAFALILLFGATPWWGQMMGNVTPPAPNVTAIYLGAQKPKDISNWQFVVEEDILTDCTAAYLYDYDKSGKLTVYEVDGGTLKALGLNGETRSCTNNRRYGVLAVNFTQLPEVLSIEVWISKSSVGGGDIYFQQLGNWRFVNGSYIGFIAPPANKDYVLLSIGEVKELMNSTGIHYVEG
jgi:hypothetical protein